MDYTSYTSIKTELKTQLSLTSGWATTLFYGVYDAIVSVVAYALHKDAYLGYYLYKESGWFTAESESSLVGMSWLLGYTPHRKIGASGSILISGSPTFSNSYIWQGNTVFIPRWTKFCNSSKSVNVYCSNFTSYYNSSTGSTSIPVKEGTPKEYTYIASGDINEKIYLYSDKSDNEEIEVLIVDSDGVVLEQVEIVENLYFYNSPTSYYCTVTNSPSFDYIYFTFGDDVSSKKLESGTRVLIKYAETNGDSGNVSASGVIVKINDVLYDSSGSAVSNVYITNADTVSQGVSYEDMESIRNNAPNLYGAGYRCGTLADWNAVVSSLSFIAKSKVWSINSIGGSSLVGEQNTMYVSAINSAGDPLTISQKGSLVTLLEDEYSSPTEIVLFQEPEYLYIYFDISCTIKNSTSSVVNSAIKSAIYDNYSTLKSSFARKVYQSEYIGIVSGVDGIVYCDVEAKMMDYNIGYAVHEYPFKAYYNATENINKVNIVQGSPEIWIKQKIDYIWQVPIKVGLASGNSFISTGNVVPTSDPDEYHPVAFSFDNTGISYVDNMYSFLITEILTDLRENDRAAYGINNPADTDPMGYIICIVYQTQDGVGDQTNSIRLSQQYQITDIDMDFIFNTITES